MRGPLVKVFSPFRLDPINQCLWRNDSRIELAPKTFSVLNYLVEHPGRLVTQSELLDAVWPETYVQPEILRTYILELRKALGDHAKQPRFIRTFPKRGYEFIALVSEEYAETESSAAEKNPIGRDAPLAALHADFQNILKSQRQVTFITGEAGIGKTTVVDTFERNALGRPGVRIARGQCLEGFGGKEAYYPVLEALGRLIARRGEDAVIEVLSRQAPTWLIQFPSLLKPAEREALQKAIFGATHERMLREICEALEALTAKEPLILILEDLHWADHSTLDLISAVARRRGPAKLMLLGTFRTVEVILSKSPLKDLKQDLLIHRLCNEVPLKGLAEAEVRQYLEAEFARASFPSLLARTIHRHCGGNPMFMVAIVNELARNGGLTMGANSVKLGVPETLRQMLDFQIEKLAPVEQRVLRCGSVAGQSFSASAVASLLDMNVADVESICGDLLKRQQFIQPAASHHFGGMNSSSHYEFRHSLYREAFYLQLPPALRVEFHVGCAGQLEKLYSVGGDSSGEMASEVALHFEHAREYERAAHYLTLSAENTARRFAHRDSVQALAHALELLARVPSDAARKIEIAVLERLSHAHYAMGEMAESAEADRKVVELASGLAMVPEQSDALARLARALAFLDPDGCVAVCERAEQICSTQPDPLLHARARLLAACWRVVNNGWNVADSQICAESREVIKRIQGTDLPAYYEILYAHVQSIQGEYLEACKTADAGLPASVETHSLVVYLSALSSKTLALLHLGSWGELRRVAETAIGMAVENGNEPWEGVFRAILAWLAQEATDYAGARRQAAELLKKYTEDPPGQVRTMALLTMSFADLDNGHAARAGKIFRQIRDRAQYPKFFLQWYWKLVAQLGLATACFQVGDLDGARAEADRFLANALLTCDPALKARAWDLQAKLALSAGEIARARECIEFASAALKPADPPPAAWRVHWTAAAICRQAGDGGGADFHQTCARAILRKLAESVEAGDPVREPLLSAAERRLPEPARGCGA
ncbi:MAG: AAA family ATPase [Bryobacterales bacterium]|nr:AAA family ATPase [Bryobacterales bacterium]MBV9399636.1 AAA family ATPase [Bryobacterales bacterium]